MKLSCLAYLPASRCRVVIAITSLLLLSISHLFAQQVTPTPPESSNSDRDKADRDDIVNMSVFTVNATQGKSYGTSSLASATRLNTPAENVPQSVSVINANLITDLSAYEYEQSVRYVPNVTQRQNQANGTMIRGLNASNRYRNGFRLPNYESDMVNIDRIEIIKGAAASISGSSESAGYVNMITKKPLWEPQGEAVLTVGTGDFIRGQFDQTGPLGSTTAYRIIGAAMQSHGWRNFEEYKKLAVFPSFNWKITKDIEWLNEVEYIYTITPGSYGTPYLAETYGNTANKIAVPANAQTTLGHWADPEYSSSEKDMNRSNTVAALFSTLTWRITPYLSLREAFLVFRNNGGLYRAEISDNFSYTADGDLVVGRYTNNGSSAETGYRNQGDIAFNYKFKDEIVGISALAGYEIIRATSWNWNLYSTTTPFSLINPVYGNLPPVTGSPTETYNTSGSSAVFINGQISFWHEFAIITAGIRCDIGHGSSNRNENTGVIRYTPKGPSVNSPLYGLTLKPYKWLAAYGVHSEAGAPTSLVSVFPNLPVDDPRQVRIPINPITTNTEFGIKTNFFDGNLSINIAHFDIKRDDVVRAQTIDDTSVGGRINIVEPGDSSKGWEVEWSGMVTKSLIIYGGYAYMDTSASGFKPDGSQRELRGVPKNKIQMFVRYDLPASILKGLALKGGIVSQSSVWGRPENTYRVDGATRVDLGAEYAWNKWIASLTVENVTGVIFPTYTVGQGSNTVDAPRTFFLSLTRKW